MPPMARCASPPVVLPSIPWPRWTPRKTARAASSLSTTGMTSGVASGGMSCWPPSMMRGSSRVSWTGGTLNSRQGRELNRQIRGSTFRVLSGSLAIDCVPTIGGSSGGHLKPGYGRRAGIHSTRRTASQRSLPETRTDRHEAGTTSGTAADGEPTGLPMRGCARRTWRCYHLLLPISPTLHPHVSARAQEKSERGAEHESEGDAAAASDQNTHREPHACKNNEAGSRPVGTRPISPRTALREQSALTST